MQVPWPGCCGSLQVSWPLGPQKGTGPAWFSGLTAHLCCQIAGKWYVVALASNSEFYLREKDRLKMVMASLSVLGPDKLKVSYAAVT